jgi:hypothetical protein
MASGRAGVVVPSLKSEEKTKKKKKPEDEVAKTIRAEGDSLE